METNYITFVGPYFDLWVTTYNTDQALTRYVFKIHNKSKTMFLLLSHSLKVFG
jgi:hypothetical protein